MARILALDIGDRYVGIAATDHIDESLAYRYGTLDRKGEDVLSALADIIHKESIDTLILGVPYHVEDGSETAQTRKTKDFINAVKGKFGSSVGYVEVDETLTSLQAKENLKIEGIDNTEEHAEAARVMLKEYLVHSR